MIKTNYNEMGTMGKRIIQRRKELNLTQREFELLCGWKGDGSRICNYERDMREPSREDTHAMATVLKVTPWFLEYGITLEGEENDINVKDFKREIVERKIPILQLGEVEAWIQGRIIKTTIKGNFMQDSRIEGHFCVEIKGNAMVSLVNNLDSYFDGELAVVNADLMPKEGDVVIFLHKHSVKIRQISKDGTETILKPLNPQYPIIMMDDEVRVFGVIISTERKRYKP